jgi:RNA polymerase-binding protein DksA
MRSGFGQGNHCIYVANALKYKVIQLSSRDLVRKAVRQVAQKRKETPKVRTRKTSKARVRKTPKAKTRKAPARKRRLTDAEIQSFRALLFQKRNQIVGDVNEMEDEALKKPRLDASGDLSSMPIHMADLGTDNYEQEFALGLMDSERKLLREIDDALQRIERGVYGICEGTGKPIPKARLRAQPWARYCVEYARMIEQGLVTGHGRPLSETPGEMEFEEG